MFKLYGNIAYSWKKLDLSVDEKDIVDTMITCSEKYHLYNYKIEEFDNNKKETRYINGKEEFAGYLHKYKQRIKPLEDMSCIDLKKYIIKKKDNKNGSK